MNLRLPPELDALKLTIRQIVKSECIPLESTFLTPHEGKDIGILPDGELDRLKRISQETGVYTMHLPERYGGGGMGAIGSVVGDEEANRSIVRLPISHVPNILIENCTKEQEERYTLPAVQGEKRACFAQTEPQAGSDAGGMMQTRAILHGSDWTINGAKMFVSDVSRADFLMLQAVTDPVKMQNGGITMFLLDTDTPGLTTSPVSTWLTPAGLTHLVFLDDVCVPHSQVLGEVGHGFWLGQQWLSHHDHLMKGSLALGILTRGLEMAIDWAKQRVTFGRPIAERQAIQWMLVDVYVAITALRRLTWEAAWRSDQGEDVQLRSSLVKYCAAEWGWRSIDKIMQIFGGLGETTEMPIPHWYHTLRHARIGGGTSEMQRSLMARALLDGAISWEA